MKPLALREALEGELDTVAEAKETGLGTDPPSVG